MTTSQRGRLVHRAGPFAVLVLLAAAACTSGGAATLLVPLDRPVGDPPNDPALAGADLEGIVRAGLPSGFPLCAEEIRWEGDQAVAHVLELPYGWTTVVTGERNDAPLVFTCDYDLEGNLLVTDSLTSTGTDQPVGVDYVTRVGAVLGRVDIGIPDAATTALYDVGGYTIGYRVGDLDVLRLHALAGGSAEAGFEMGTLTFQDAEGEDVTPESAPVPDVIHGVPRDRGSGVEDAGEDDEGG